MSKSRNKKWYDYDEYEYVEDQEHERKLEERRKQKKIKNALRTKDIGVLVEDEQ
jgi:hypothetical protein